MKTASIHELKQELLVIKPVELLNLCLRLSKFKKENKELLTYLLFEANNENGYVAGVKQEIDELFSTINLSQLYFAKKSLRKIARIINKYCRYSGINETEIELRIYFCELIKDSGIPISKNPVIKNLYDSQVKKICSIVETLHEDLQYEFIKAVELLR
ncbi:MAG: hypothetical protein ACKVOW_11050 [Chitinophagaceae bacterium]